MRHIDLLSPRKEKTFIKNKKSILNEIPGVGPKKENL